MKCLVLAVVLSAVLVSVLPPTAHAAFVYSIPKQRDLLVMNADGSVRLERYFEFQVEETSTDPGTEIWAGLPTAGTKVLSVVDEDGDAVKFGTRSSGGEYHVTLSGFSIKPGTKKGFTVTAEIPNFIFRDTKNAGYVTMEYSPGWWTAPVAVQDIGVILPDPVTEPEIKTGAREWDGITRLDRGAYLVTWQFKDLRSNERVTINVGIPDKYVKVPEVTKPESPVLPPQQYVRPGPDPSMVFGIGVVVIVGAIILEAISKSGREPYTSPQVSMEGVGVNETLDPVEASILLRQPPEKTLTLLLFSMIKKGYLRVIGQDPLKVAVMYERDLSEAERLFIEAIDRSTGEIDGSKLAPCFRYLATSVNEKLKPYCRKETEEFYRGVIRQAWDSVLAAETPELKLSAMDRQLMWLLQDEDRMKEAESKLPREGDAPRDAVPNWWTTGLFLGVPFGPYYMWPGFLWSRYSRISGGLLDRDSQQELRGISNQIWTPARPPSGGRFGGGRGGFTPPSCACACACVSCACACACAGGGGGT